MKNFFNVTYKNSSKPFAYFVILLIVIAIIAGIAGCGSDDNPVGGNGNPPVNNDSLVFSLDSVVSRGTLPTSNDSVISVNFANIDSAKISFSLESNFPGTMLTGSIKTAIDTTSTGVTIWGMPVNQNQNESFVIGFTPTQNHTIVKIAVGHILNGTPEYTFVKLYNIKLIKIR